MKKLISLLLAAAFIYTALLCACTNKPEETSAPVTETEAGVTEDQTEETEAIPLTGPANALPWIRECPVQYWKCLSVSMRKI